MTVHVGQAWLEGGLAVYEEHLYTEVVQQALNEVTLQAQARHIELQMVQASSGQAMIRGDAVQIRRALINLINNAIKFAKPSVAPVIQIGCEELTGSQIPNTVIDKKKLYYHITVADNGIGFEPEHSDRIFMLFQRLHGRGEYNGTGIGLAICKKIVENHRGYIFAEGNPEIGTTIIIYLPVA